METEVNRGCRTLLWALANKWESADICTPSQLRKSEREGETRETERLREGRRRQDSEREKKVEGGEKRGASTWNTHHPGYRGALLHKCMCACVFVCICVCL